MPWKPPPKTGGSSFKKPPGGGGGGAPSGFGGSAFGQSAFFLKKQGGKAKKIQAMVRMFLVQARLFREHTLSKKMQEVEAINQRKAEEIKKINAEKEVTLKQCPELVKEEFIKLEKDSQECKVIIEELKVEVEKERKDHDELATQKDEFKKINKQLKKETAQKSKGDFKLEVQKMKLETEKQKMQGEWKSYREAMFDGICQVDEVEENLRKCVHQKKVFKRYLKAIMQVMEDRALGYVYDPLVLVGIEFPSVLPHVDFSTATIPRQPDEIEPEMDWTEYKRPRLTPNETGVTRVLLKKLKAIRSSNLEG